MKNRFPALAVAVAVTTLIVAACATPPSDTGTAAKGAPAAARPGPPGVSPELAEAARRTRLPNPDDDTARLYKGTGVVVKGQVPGGGLPPIPRTQVAQGGGVILHFEGADLREVIKNILGDILNEKDMADINEATVQVLNLVVNNRAKVNLQSVPAAA